MPDSKRRKMGLPTKIQKLDVMEETEKVEEIDTVKDETMNEGSVITSTSSDRLTPDEPPSTMVHYEPSHAAVILAALKDGQHSDITLKVGAVSIPAHKCILMSSSAYFAKKLSADAKVSELELVDCPAEAVADLIDYVYTSRLKITQTTARDLLSAACRLELASAQSALELYLKMRMTTALAIQTLKKQRGIDSDSLLEVARNYATTRFNDVANHVDFETIPYDELETMIQSNALQVKSEEDVYYAVLKWIKSDLTSRSPKLHHLLEHVRLPLATPQFLLDVVELEPLIKQNSDCSKLITEARRYHMLIDQRPLLQSPRTVPRKSSAKKQRRDYVVVLGGLNRDKQQMHDCFYFRPPLSNLPVDNQSKDGFICRPQRLQSPPINQTTYAVAEINNIAVLTGGIKQCATDEVHAYIPSLDVWQQMASMSSARFLHSSASLDGYLYVAGGMVNAQTRLDSVERWCPNTNKWETVASLPVQLSSLCLVACSGQLYAIGGISTGSKTVASVYHYDPSRNYWQEDKPLPEPERGASAVSIQNKIYAFGDAGRFYCFDTERREWTRLKNTNGGHTHGATTIFKDRVYISGGLHCSEFINRTVEVYDAAKDSWTNVAVLPTPVYAHGLISLTIEST